MGQVNEETCSRKWCAWEDLKLLRLCIRMWSSISNRFLLLRSHNCASPSTLYVIKSARAKIWMYMMIDKARPKKKLRVIILWLLNSSWGLWKPESLIKYGKGPLDRLVMRRRRRELQEEQGSRTDVLDSFKGQPVGLKIVFGLACGIYIKTFWAGYFSIDHLSAVRPHSSAWCWPMKFGQLTYCKLNYLKILRVSMVLKGWWWSQSDKDERYRWRKIEE